MAGLIQNQMEEERDDEMEVEREGDAEEQEAEAPAAPAAQATDGEYTAERARSEMEIPDELKDAYERVVEAGLKVMFDPSMRERTMEFMQGEGDPATKLGEGVAAVMALLFKESNNTMPPQVVIPAGVELLLHAADVAKAGGMGVDQNVVAEAMAIMVEAVFRQFGADPQQMQMMINGDAQ